MEKSENRKIKQKTGVLFVCTGNICRSPTADGVFRHVIAAHDLQDKIRVDSVGTHGYHVGDPPDPRAIKYAAKRGYRLHDLRARKLSPSDFYDFDYLLAMDEGHLRQLQKLRPEDCNAHISLFSSFLTGAQQGIDVPDPYYGADDGFDHVLDLVEQGTQLLLSAIKTRVV